MDGNAIIYCEGAFNTPNGKTTHGLVRFTERYDVLSVIDSRYAGQDAGEILDGGMNMIPVYSTIQEGVEHLKKMGMNLILWSSGLLLTAAG